MKLLEARGFPAPSLDVQRSAEVGDLVRLMVRERGHDLDLWVRVLAVERSHYEGSPIVGDATPIRFRPSHVFDVRHVTPA